jgi:hypothetical protein
MANTRKGLNKMAKKNKVASVETTSDVAGQIDLNLLSAIGSGKVNYVSREDGLPLLQHNPPLIEVNMNDVVDGKAAVRLTDAGNAMVAANSTPVPAHTHKYDIITGVEIPKPKRSGGGAGAPVVYPFDKMDVGHSFFVPVSAKHPDPVKTLGSTVSSANMRYAVETGEQKQITRTKRGDKNKAMLDANGNKIKETVIVPVRKATRKFVIRPVKAGVKYGEWMAESDGSLIARIA